jgi:Tol biopolymer transport system component
MKSTSIRFAVALAAIVLFSVRNGRGASDPDRSVDRFPRLHPDYSGTVMPLNIAPLNFRILEKGSGYRVTVHSTRGKAIELSGRTPDVEMPEKAWHALLNENPGEDLRFEISVKTADGTWSRFQTVSNRIAAENIDGFLVYRKIHPSHNSWRDMGLYQRNLATFEESPILTNDQYQTGCAHCHAFLNNDPDHLSVDVRKSDYADFKSSQLIIEGGKVTKLDNVVGFTAWHPSGRMLACTVNKTGLILHSARNEMRDIVDRDSWIGYFFLGSNKIKTVHQLSQKDRLENYPAWSPDGRYLYFCSAKMLWTDKNPVPPEHYEEVRYDLVRIPYDIDTDRWGELEYVLLSKDTGRSMNQPRISPDGRWLTFNGCDYSCWPSYHTDADLYIVDLKKAAETGRYECRKMEINTEQCESWHTWSSNSRWIVFSSKKGNPLFNRSYITYVNDDGTTAKAFVLPQRDPTFYDTYPKTYTIPELVKGPVRIRGEKLAGTIRGSEKTTLDMAITAASPKTEQ